MQLSLSTIGGMLSAAAAAAQAACAQLLDLTIGSPARALLQATTALWSVQQANTFAVLATTRLATSSGADVDTFVADYSMQPRLAGAPSVGPVTFILSPGSAATVPVGDTVRTGDASLTFTITADPTNVLFSAMAGNGQGAYVAPAGTASFTAPVQCTVAGTAGNVITGAISLMGTGIAGINSVSNVAPLTGGIDRETDDEVKARFAQYIQSLSKATLTAIEEAIESVQAGITYKVLVNTDEAGNSRPGHFVCYIDDGSGHPPPSLLAQVYSAVDAIRAVCETFSVQPPSVLDVTVALTITVSTGTNKAALLAPVQSAVAAYVNAIPVGGTVSITRIAAAAYAVSSGITNVSGVSITGAGIYSPANDQTTGPTQVPKVVAVTVS